MIRRPTMRLLAVVAAIGIVAASFLSATAASALTSASNVLQFSNALFTSPVGPLSEDLALKASMEASGATVTLFNGGDGSAGAWTAALAGKDTLAFSDADVTAIYAPGGTTAMSDAAAVAVTAWVSAGGIVILAGGYYHINLLSAFTGLDYSPYNSFVPSPGGLGWALQAPVPGLPATLSDTNAAYGLTGFDTWPALLTANVTAAYLSPDGTDLGVGFFSVGSGGVIYYAYDWFPNGGPEIAAWDTVLQTLGNAPAAATPTLPATGTNVEAPLYGATVLLLVGAAIVLVTRRRSSAAS